MTNSRIQFQTTHLLVKRPIIWLACCSLFSCSSSAMSTAKPKVIDSHLHVWANKEESSSGFPYAEGQDPPASLMDRASTSALLNEMKANGVDGALIVQPINHKFDHSYVIQAMRDHPNQFKGMLLHDPSIPSKDEAIEKLEDLALKGFVGVRFNPYLWPKLDDNEATETKKWVPMSSSTYGYGLDVYKRCGELHMAVGVMCFQGLQYHYDDIVTLIESSPNTKCILDHFGFTSLTPEGDKTFEQLLSLSKYPNVYIKLSAVFRLKDDDSAMFDRVQKERFEPLVAKFGCQRLMFGTDFPFVLEQSKLKGHGGC